MRLWAVSIMAGRWDGNIYSTQSKAAVIERTEEWEMGMLGLELALEEFPISDGWEQHQITYCEVPQDFIKRAYHV